MSNIFDQYYKKYDAWYDRNPMAYLSELEAIKKFLPKRGKGLEIGVGTGRFAFSLGVQEGIDPSKKMLQIAQKRGIKTRWGHGEDLPYADSTFEYVIIIIALCFVRDPSKVLDEARRVLKTRGRIVIGIIDKDSFLGEFYQRKKSMFYKHANFFGVLELMGMLKTAGFNRMFCRQTLFHPLGEITSVEISRPGFGQGGFVVISARKNFSKKRNA